MVPWELLLPSVLEGFVLLIFQPGQSAAGSQVRRLLPEQQGSLIGVVMTKRMMPFLFAHFLFKQFLIYTSVYFR